MRVIESVPKMKEFALRIRAGGERLGLVPTMGFLHEGHLSLVRASLRKADHTVVSVFVNPAQFAPHEDFSDYPRDLERDLDLLRREGVDTVFTPSAEELYPSGYATFVEVHGLQERLCGQSRPTFFRGVCTVVLKLFNIIQPDLAFFGQKDAQQVQIIKRMTGDLDLDVVIDVCPIVREEDGLALSSRNVYLDPELREAALCLWRSLELARSLIQDGERNAQRIKERIQGVIRSEPKARIDYAEIVDAATLLPRDIVQGGDLIALAVHIDEKVRLIDNMVV
jgi:pantoate--beta-alanine ligase